METYWLGAVKAPATSYSTIKVVAISTAPVLALRIVRDLRRAGHTAYLVGGCVRDLLLDRPAKDFDVATSARPEAVLALFPGAGQVGAHFGVVLVQDGAATVEVATFRSDHAYLDGRHPESVTFETDPRQDALRRDFTINAMMMDPSSGAVLDFAGGRADLAAGIVRAVGDPLARFGEDHLRMLRAVRFAARLGFAIEPDTLAAIRALAPRLQQIAAERVHDEFARILTEGGAQRGLELLNSSGLLAQVLPEAAPLSPLTARMFDGFPAGPDRWPLALSMLLHATEPAAALARLRCSRDVADRVTALLAHRARFAQLPAMSRADRKRFLRMPHFGDHLELHRRWRLATGAPLDVYDFAAAHLQQDALFPPRLVTGDDLLALGLPQGPIFKELLDAVETEQLEERLTTRGEALEFLRRRVSGPAII